MKIFVVNLADSVLRRSRVAKRLDELDCDYEFFSAIDGRSQSHPLFDRYDDRLRRRIRRKPLSGGELGCWASHFILWQRCVELDHPVVVMEDDVEITAQFPAAITQAKKLITQIPYLRLAGTHLYRRPYNVISEAGEFSLVDHIRGPAGTLCYVIQPAAAQKFIDHASKWFLAVDDYMDRYWVHGVDCFSLMPFPVLVGDSKSDIVRFKKEKISLWLKLRQDINRLTAVFGRRLYRFKLKMRRKRSRNWQDGING